MNEEIFKSIIMSSPILKEVITKAASLSIKNYYIGAGAVAQTVWNHFSNKPFDYGINDIDFVYFDNTDLSEGAENKVINEVKALYPSLGVSLDVKNEARVHLWYKSHFGYDITPYSSLEKAIDTWPTTATAVGVKLKPSGDLKVYSPFGLCDLLNMTVRANKTQITKEIYEAKVNKWTKKWPNLKVIPW